MKVTAYSSDAFPEDGHLVGVAAEEADVILDPSEDGVLVLEA
jgi:hypothetical protein